MSTPSSSSRGCGGALAGWRKGSMVAGFFFFLIVLTSITCVQAANERKNKYGNMTQARIDRMDRALALARDAVAEDASWPKSKCGVMANNREHIDFTYPTDVPANISCKGTTVNILSDDHWQNLPSDRKCFAPWNAGEKGICGCTSGKMKAFLLVCKSSESTFVLKNTEIELKRHHSLPDRDRDGGDKRFLPQWTFSYAWIKDNEAKSCCHVAAENYMNGRYDRWVCANHTVTLDVLNKVTQHGENKYYKFSAACITANSTDFYDSSTLEKDVVWNAWSTVDAKHGTRRSWEKEEEIPGITYECHNQLRFYTVTTPVKGNREFVDLCRAFVGDKPVGMFSRWTRLNHIMSSL